MIETRKKLPALVVPPEGYDLVRSFARRNDISISEAIRQLLQRSPDLVEFAEQTGRDVDNLNVGAWGGHSKEHAAQS